MITTGQFPVPKFDNIPEVYRCRRSWMLWRLMLVKGRWTKVPFSAVNPSRNAKSDDPSTWSDFETTVSVYLKPPSGIQPFDGIGMANEGGEIFVDLDGCFDFGGTEPRGWTAPYWDAFRGVPGYTELSVSRTGLHKIVAVPDLPGKRKQLDLGDHTGVAFYDAGRYLTFSGEEFMDGSSSAGEHNPEEIRQKFDRLYLKVFPVTEPPRNGTGRRSTNIPDDEILNIALRRDAKLSRLFEGKWQGDYPSQSEADEALCMKLAFWFDREAGRIDQIFRQSGLMREKWNREDYRSRTIDNAISMTAETFKPRSSRPEEQEHSSEAPPEQPRVHVDDGWSEPTTTLQGDLPAVINLDEELIPASFRPLVCDVADLMNVPLDFPAVTQLVTLAGAVNRRAAIQPKECDSGWTEVGNLWGVLVAEPGLRKSPALNAITKPLRDIQSGYDTDHEVALLTFARNLHKAELARAVWDELHKAKSKERYRKTQGQAITDLPDEPPDMPEEPTARRLIINDATFEATHQLMSRNPEGLFQIRDELSGWLASMEKEDRKDERAFHLECWNGKNSFVVDRIVRGQINVKACCTSLFGGIQPGRLRSYLADALADGPGNDGMFQRFQASIYPDMIAWKYVDREPAAEHLDRARSIFQKLVDMDATEPPLFKFSPEAQDLFIGWLALNERKVRDLSEHAAIRAHLAKYPKLMVTLALLFELSDRAAHDHFWESTDYTVSLTHAQQAAGWCEYFESHARRIYSCYVNRELKAARDLLAKIREGKLPRKFKRQDVYLKCWSGLDDVESAKAALFILEDAGWIREVATEKKRAGGRPAITYEVNPAVYR